MTQLRFYNTLTRNTDILTPDDPHHLKMYVCGPTVYDHPHIGNARSVVVYDVIYRLLKASFARVTYVRNITDVDDKINAAAKQRGISIQALTQEVTAGFHQDMEALHCLRPDVEPRATEHIPDMIAMIESLITHGNAYVAQGHVMFDVESASTNREWHYGMLSHRKREDLLAGARVEVESYKKHPGDFVLWKPADADDSAGSVFDSPWGKGRPGWHIECSAMSTRYLGVDFDIHGGGADLMFPHHENEIAQTCCAHPASRFARMWIHNGFLTVNGEKMSKSSGNFITVRALLDKGIKGEVIRFALLSTGYNKPLDWTEKLVEDAKKSLDYFYKAMAKAKLGGASETFGMGHAFSKLLADDLNVPAYFAKLHEVAGDCHRAAEGSEEELRAAETLAHHARFLGLCQEEPSAWLGKEDNADIDAEVAARGAAKKAKNWQEADRIREQLKAQGIVIEDKPDGSSTWRRVSQ